MLKDPLLILVSGPPGCGKSTLGQALAREIGVPILDKDCIDEPFSPDERGETYTQRIEPKVLEALFTLAEDNLRCGVSVILDAPWTHIMVNEPRWQQRALELEKKVCAKLVVLECVVSETTLRKRIEARGLRRDAVKLEKSGWLRFCEHDRIGEKNPLPHVVIDMEQSPKVVLKQAMLTIEPLYHGARTGSQSSSRHARGAARGPR